MSTEKSIKPVNYGRELSINAKGRGYMSCPKDMLTLTLCNRKFDRPQHGLERFLYSIVDTTTAEERKNIEVLIKGDDDDEPYNLPAMPFIVKTWQLSRGEGRHGLHTWQEILFSKHDPRTKIVQNTADDFEFIRKGWVSDLLNIDDPWVLCGKFDPPVSMFFVSDWQDMTRTTWLEYHKRNATAIDIDSPIMCDFTQERNARRWSICFGDMAPAMGIRFCEAAQNMGWQTNTDAWVMCLSLLLWKDWGLNLWKSPPEYYRRHNLPVDDARRYTPTYNSMEIEDRSGPNDPYYYRLMRQQAANIALSMIYMA